MKVYRRIVRRTIRDVTKYTVFSKLKCDILNKSSAVAEIGDCGHDRDGPKTGGADVPLSRELGVGPV